MINQSPDRQSYNKRIQETQNNIDKTDSKLDSRIDIDGMDPEEQEALKEAYIDKVNLMQGKVHRSFENIDIKRNLRSPQWRKWEKEIITVEANLLMILRKESSRLNRSNKEANATSGLDDFNKKIDSFLHEIDAINEVHNTPAPAEKLNEKEPEKLRSADAIFHEWNVPGTDEEITEKAQKANERYGEETLRNLDATLSLYDALDPELRKKLFKQRATVRLPQVAGQLANGTFESSPLGFLLTEDIETIEGQLLIEREEIIDVIGRKTSEVQSLKEATTDTITRLCKVAGIDVGKENVLSDIYSWMANTNGKPELQKKIVGEIRDMAKKVTELQKESQDLYPQVTTIERAFNVFDTNNARNVGNAKEEAQLRYRGALEYGIPFPGDAELQKLLRPTQMNLLKGEPEKALHVSIDELNTFMEQNPNLDTLHRVDVLSLHSVRKRKVTKATFQTFTVASNPLDAFRRSKNAAFDIGGSLDTKQKTYTVLTELGTLANGDEIIAIKLPPYNGRPSEKVIAIRNTNGIIQLQDGTVIEKPDKLQPMIINSMNGDGETTYVSKETSKYLQENVNIGSKNRVILRNRDAINSKESFTGGTSIRMLDTSQLQLASRDAKGMLIIKGADGKQEESINEEFLLKGSAEHGGDVLQSIDKNPIVQGITKRAGGLQENMQNMQTMLETAMDSKATTQGAFVDQMRSYARPMLATMEDPATRQNIVQAKNLLQSELSRVKLGSYVGSGIESEIQDRIDALDGYITVLNDNQLKNALQNAMELKPEEWAEWLSTDGLIMLGAIALAVVAIVALTVLTGGAGLIAISAVGAAGGLIGGELTKEGLHYAYNTWGGAASGEYRYNDRSRFGAYLEGQKLYDPKTKEFVDMSFLENVAAPYARDFAVSFATTALALGAGQAVGNSLSKLAQNSKWIQALSKNNKVANSIMKKLSGLADDAATIPKNMKEFAGKSLKEIADELGDELVLEKSAESVLNRIDSRLGSLATFFVAAGKGFKPMAGGKLSYGAEKKSADVRVDIESQGHTIVSEINGVFDVKTYDGKTLIIEPETVTEATGNTEALDLATQHDLAALKEYVKAHDIDDSTRITLAETVLDRTLSPADRKALITAHNKPGTIDELTPSELKVKATELRNNATFTKTERRMLIEAGLAGAATLEAPSNTSVTSDEALEQGETSTEVETTREFADDYSVTGRDPDTGKSKTVEFEAIYEGGKNTYDVTITSPKNPRVKIELQYSIRKSGVKQVIVKLGMMGELSGGGFYSKIMSKAFEGVTFIDGSIANDETNVLFNDHSEGGGENSSELAALNDDYREPHNVPYSVLMTYSPTAAVRKGFMTRAERGSPIDLISERVEDPKLQNLLNLSQGWERSRRADTPQYTRKFYQENPDFSIVGLTQEFEAYIKLNQELDENIKESLEVQIQHMTQFAAKSEGGSLDNGLNYKQQVIAYLVSNDISPKDRVALASSVLGRELTPKQQGALLRAHKIGLDREGASIGNYNDQEKFSKGRLLMAKDDDGNPLFTRQEADILLEVGLAGRPPVIGTRKGPPPPPPMRNKKRPPPAIGVMKSSPESKKAPLLPSMQLSDINVLTGDQRKAYIKSKMNNPLWIRSLGAAQRRMTVFPSKENTHHILWVKDNSGPTNTVGAKTLSYKYLMSPEGSLEHSIFLEGEKMMMKAFADAQSMFPKNVKVATGFTVESMSADTGMSHGNLLGYKVNTDNTNRLFTLIEEARKTGDYSKVESHIDWIKSAFAHETTHAARNDLDNHPGLNANEVPSHAVQFLTIWDKPDRFFSQRISSLKNKPLSSFGRIHAELGGLKVVQEKLIACSDCSYKPKDLTPVELKKAIESIPEAMRGSVIDTMVAELVTTPVADFQANVRTVFDESQK